MYVSMKRTHGRVLVLFGSITISKRRAAVWLWIRLNGNSHDVNRFRHKLGLTQKRTHAAL